MKALVTVTDFSAQQKTVTARLELVPSAEMTGEKGIGLDTDIEVEVSPGEGRSCPGEPGCSAGGD